MTTTKKKTPATRKPRVVKAPVPIPNLPRKPFVFEVLDLVSKQKTKAKKVQVLQKYDEFHLRTIFLWNFDEVIQSVLPEGEVPYTPNDAPLGTDHTRLWSEYKGLYRFVKGGADKLTRTRRENLFIQLLENLHPDEAEIVALIKDGGLQTKIIIGYSILSTCARKAHTARPFVVFRVLN